VKSRLPPALLLAAVITAGATACDSGVLMCACPASRAPIIVCGTQLTGRGPEPVPLLSLNARTGRVRRTPKRSIIPPPTTWAAVKNMTVDTITTGAKCTRAPLVTVKPLTAARTLAVARGRNGGIAGLTLAVISNTSIVVRAYLGRHLVGRLTVPGQMRPSTAPPAPAAVPARSPNPGPVPCGRPGRPGGQGAGSLFCLGPTTPAAR
jgi:hypothetical protein